MIWPLVLGGSALLLILISKAGRPSGFTPLSVPRPPPLILSALRAASAKHGVPLNILIGVAHTESRYNPRAVSPVGAKGLMQLMPVIIDSYGIADPFDPLQNAMGGAKFLAKYYRIHGNWPQVLAAYNWGPGNAKLRPSIHQWPAATQTYVSQVMGKAAA